LNKKYAFAKKVGLATTPEETEAELMMSLLLDLNASAHADPNGQWMTLVDTEETVHDVMRRTHGSTLLNLDDMDETSSVPSDELGLLSSKVVDVQSNQQRCSESSLLMRTVQQDCFESFLVDVPSQ